MSKSEIVINDSVFKVLFENAFDGIVLYDIKGIIRYASPSVKRSTGFLSQKVVGTNGLEYIHPDEKEKAREIFYLVASGNKKTITATQRFRHKKGHYYWSEYTLTNMLHNPQIRGIVSNFREVTKKIEVENQTKRNEKLLNLIGNNLLDGIFIGIPQKEFHYVNKTFLKITGYKSLEDLNKIEPRQLYTSKKEWQGIRDQVNQDGEVKNHEISLRKKNGTKVPVAITLSNFIGEDGLQYFVGSLRDLSKIKETENELLNNQRIITSINKNISEGIFRSEEKSGLIYSNEAFLKMLGYKKFQEMAKIHPRKLFGESILRKKLIDDLKKNKSIVRELELKKKNGIKFWVEASLSLHKEGASIFIDGAIRDITEQKELRRKQLEASSFLQNIVDTVAAPIFVKDSKHRFVVVNSAFCKLIDRKREQILNKTDATLFGPTVSRGFHKVDRVVLKTGMPTALKDRYQTKNGAEKTLWTVKARYEAVTGENFVIAFTTDITESEKDRKKIETLYSNLQGIMESTDESIYSIDRNFEYLSFNTNHQRVMLSIYNKSISIGSNKKKALAGSLDEKWVMADLRKALRGKQFTTERLIDYPNYRNRYISSTYNPILDKDGNVIGVAVFVRDVTEFKEIEKGLKKANSFLSGVMESTRDRIIAVDRKYNYLMFNEAHQRDVKFFSGGQVKIGENFIDVLPKEAGERARKDLKRAFKGENFSNEFMPYENFFIDVSYNPIYNEEKRIIGASLFVRDTTSRKATEFKIKKLNEELIQQNTQLASQEEELRATLGELSERNFELDQLMYKTSHDLRAPLSSILGLVSLAKMEKNESNRQLYISKIAGRINKLDEFIRSMLNYAKVNRGEISSDTVALIPLIETCINQLEYLENFKLIRTEIKATPADFTFKSDSFLLTIIVSNIISNAYKYANTEVKGNLKVRVRKMKRQVQLVIEDNGIGIRKEYQPKIFDMFYRATERSQGSGLGLYIVKQAVEKLNGSIEIKSIFGKGTKIKITLPISE